jgi:hypothetical protein
MDRQRLVAAADRLIDGGALLVQGSSIEPQRSRGVEIGQRAGAGKVVGHDCAVLLYGARLWPAARHYRAAW